ncbi:MAG TPA: metalloregulator ArsR/SmtB family transcription factor [Thermoanaerobaculia bacterium]|jgi:DNA-binding transcriptional ArsR family regulator|nr:metalloregulator ArsR/SmtB family transcription factor [Thermoanaerobaculia bacterium]
MPGRRFHPDLPPEAIALVAGRFRVLAEPLRLRILQVLRGGEKNVGELTAALETTQPNVSKHLRVLQEAGFIGRRQEGNNAYWSITDESVFDLCDLVCNALYTRVSAHVRLLKETPSHKRR